LGFFLSVDARSLAESAHQLFQRINDHVRTNGNHQDVAGDSGMAMVSACRSTKKNGPLEEARC